MRAWHLERALHDRNGLELGHRVVPLKEVVSSRQRASRSPFMVSDSTDQLSAATHRAQTLARGLCDLMTSNIGYYNTRNESLRQRHAATYDHRSLRRHLRSRDRISPAVG